MSGDKRQDDSIDFHQFAAIHLARGSSATFGTTVPLAAAAKGTGAQRRRAVAAKAVTTAQVLLVEDSRGLAHWEYHSSGLAAGLSGVPAGGAQRLSRYRGRYRSPSMAGTVIASAEAAEIGPNQVTAALERLDLTLTPDQGLRFLNAKVLESGRGDITGRLALAKRVLLMIHGTFSSGEMYTSALSQEFLDLARAKYSEVVAFDHPTLSVSPILNSIDLENALVKAGLPVSTPIDVICHSRGGLVAAWWIRGSRFTIEKLVAVGAPLVGTSLASPYRIRYLLDYYGNYSKMIGRSLKAAALVPTFAAGFLAGAGGLMGILGGFTSAVSALPIADAGIALVPGLHSMSRVNNNAEINRLWETEPFILGAKPVKCFAVTSDFEPRNDKAWWDLWGQLKELPWAAADGAADKLFPGANDLVVDTDSMKTRGFIDTLSFSGREGVHHCEYFTNPKTILRLEKWLELTV